MTGKRRVAGPRIIRAVMKRIEEGGLDPGERILPREIARILGISDIPVREAFHHLAGRGILTERHGEGFYAAALNSSALRTLYTIHGRLTEALLCQWDAKAPINGRFTTPWKLFDMLADRAVDEGLAGMERYASGRLALARRYEAPYVAYDSSTRRLAGALREGDKTAARRAARDFHRACACKAPAIWRSMMDK